MRLFDKTTSMTSLVVPFPALTCASVMPVPLVQVSWSATGSGQLDGNRKIPRVPALNRCMHVRVGYSTTSCTKCYLCYRPTYHLQVDRWCGSCFGRPRISLKRLRVILPDRTTFQVSKLSTPKPASEHRDSDTCNVQRPHLQLDRWSMQSTAEDRLVGSTCDRPGNDISRLPDIHLRCPIRNVQGYLQELLVYRVQLSLNLILAS